MDEQDQDALRYVLYLAKLRLDGRIEDIPLYAYGQTEEQAWINLHLWFLPKDWDEIEIVSMTPHLEGYQYVGGPDMPGRINQAFYDAYLTTVRPINRS